MSNLLNSRNLLPALLYMPLICCQPIAATASTVFSDNTFDLNNYIIDTYQSGGATINTFQTLTDGNPGAALQSIISEPSINTPFFTTQVIINSTFNYDPGSQGAIQSINVSGDIFINLQNLALPISFAAPIISQNGNYYAGSIDAPIQNNVWQSGSESGLLSTDFVLVTDPLMQTSDPTSHPDFNSGSIGFGVAIFTSSDTANQPVWDIRIDNLSYTVNAVPVPPAIWLFGSGLLGLLGAARRKQLTNS
ncbi:MAG: hypothetical protein WBO34_03245 [Gammaproteobacteria bacterium]